jgi:hypothetical protein
LEENLFRGLRGDTAEFFHRHGQQQCIADFDFIAAELASFFNRKLCRLVLHFFDDDF